MSRYANHVSRKVTPQSEPIPGSAQVKNSAGGYSFEVTDWVRLDRFIVLGSEGGSYYATERALTRSNAAAIEKCIAEDGLRVVARIIEISQAGRAPKNDPAIFALALAAKTGNDETRKAALAAIPLVCRIGTHLFQFVEALQQFGGWGRGTRRAIANWYLDKTPENLAYQLIKYRQRNGWAHRDIFRLAHPKLTGHPENGMSNTLAFAVGKGISVGVTPIILHGFEEIQKATTVKEAVAILTSYPQLPWETVPSELLKSPDIWAVLLPNMKLTALVRNLARMTANGLIAPMSPALKIIEDKLSDVEAVRKQKVHPIQMLAALCTYKQGHGVRGSLTWTPEPRVVDTLDAAFYLAFGNVEASNKRTMLALDISGSMGGGEIAGIPGLTPRMGSVAMAMLTARTEREYHFMGFGDNFHPLNITAKQSLESAVSHVSGLPFGGTDCALPMIHAERNKIPVDTFQIFTDNETWAGDIHPSQALNRYRQKMGIPAKLAVIGMTSNGFTIASPSDSGMQDFVGFDTATPNLITDFAVR